MLRTALLAICLATAVRAQYPPDMHWRKILTPHFEIVFPKEIEADAERAANTLETLYGPLTDSLGIRFKRVTVLLPNQGVTRYAGGSVSLFPRMAAFNTMPSQGFWGTNDWLTVLAAGRIGLGALWLTGHRTVQPDGPDGVIHARHHGDHHGRAHEDLPRQLGCSAT